MRQIKLSITTAADGSATVTSTEFVNGLLYGFFYAPGTIATGGDLTISFVNSASAQTLLTITNAGTSNVSWYPRGSSCGATGTSTSDNLVMIPVIGYLKVVVAEGGNAASGALYGYVLEME